jgi:prepilin-type N-terminal cleavage/methylation domain-containing protein
MVKKNKGVTLIELMVGIAIIAILLAAGTPLAIGWINSSKMQQTVSVIKQGMTIAKSKSLQNPSAAKGNELSSVLIAKDAELCVYDKKPASMACNLTGVVWKATTPGTFLLNGANPQCIALNNAGMAVSDTIGTTVCGTALTYSASKGNENDQGDLY